MTADILGLSWKIQVALASGYAGYLLAYIGIRWGHRSVDTAFITLIFGLVATAVISALSDVNPIYASIVAFLATCAVAIAWRRFMRNWLFAALHKANISWSNDDHSALATLSNNNKFRISQVAVQLTNGTWLRCDDASKFNDTPFGPLILGPNGDMAFYLTHEEPSGGAAKELSTVRDTHYGDRITYIPSERIQQITVRHKVR